MRVPESIASSVGISVEAARAADPLVEDDRLRRVLARKRLGVFDGGGCPYVEAALHEGGRQPLAEGVIVFDDEQRGR